MEQACNRELIAALGEMLYRADRPNPLLESELCALEDRYRDDVYSELIHLACQLRFEPADAKQHWRRILQHREAMCTLLKSPVDLRVALTSYFLQVHPKLENPRIVESVLFERTLAGAYRDELTGLFNYRYFGECLRREMLRAERSSTPFSLVMIDIDDFKAYNDSYGHEAGNVALAAIARSLESSLRGLDVAVRYGGEEFALVLPETPKTGAWIVGERVRTAVEHESFFTPDPTRLTISMGGATFPGDGDDPQAIVRSADAALYDAKAAGKNRLHLYGSGTRSFRRLEIALPGHFRTGGDDYHPMQTCSLSVGGVAFRTDHEVCPDTLIDVRLALPDGQSEVAAAGRVVATRRQDRSFETSVRFTEMGAVNRMQLAGYLQVPEPA